MYSDPHPIQQLVNCIVEAVHPLRVILFGSAARGEIGHDSDLDILVVMPEGTHRRRTEQYLYQKIEGVTVPYDIMVATPGDLEAHKNNVGLIYRTVLEEGKTLYAA